MSTNQNQTAPQAATEAKRYDPPSHYVIPAYYDWLMQASDDLSSAVRTQENITGPLRHEIESLLSAEARLLDQHAFDTWLEMYSEECAYWIPPAYPARDPRESVTLEFHDRRRLLDRVARLQTGLAYSQWPASRTARVYSGLEIWSCADRDDEWRARYNFTLVESRSGVNRLLGGWNGFVIRRTPSGPKVILKQINLIDCDQAQGNNSFFL
ncbi:MULTISPECIES: aromatic-ring-hydroxylating dioxygenase subunit beta [Pseudomonadaceae]|uniref:Aromatic-ring-hydroxylating dioxygenase n=1 Tax=Stutzerimonas xanthomarina TaxID=271420 RepID=A0A427DK56_9GAMM|nr:MULTISPECIES: aromatic-ring-hydroxylating dioxygenase subunit beta [Pseudomonadaceae]MDB1107857.1 aromatic-ring-hydroxylating dioxygenase subunit beta [Pseudomonas extremaustralis]RRV03597.1 hypothetical protein EGJ28_23650 [Stutzerimonas xanthomarina]RZO10702.1 hypothetical protein EKG40_03810 [Pseudomonas moorei]WQN29915.1 aromatic-ring-hydroxylating dioxygenase subunit beta [Stutzerimonas stutzeri]